MKSLYLVDVSSMFFRAFYAIRPLTNSKGLPTNAIYGFLSMTVKILREIRPDYMAFCFDRPEPSFRKDLDVRYKANRSEMPEDLQPQIPYIRQLAHALGIPCFDVERFEADDVIGTLTLFGRRNELDVVIVSSDKDFGQLLQPCVSMYDTMKDVRYDVVNFKEKWGVEPSQMIDFLAITGDASDNIPGVAGIGKVGAQKLLAEFGTLERTYESLSQIKSKSTVKKLEESREEAFLSKKLVTIVTDVPIQTTLEDLRLRPIVREELRALLEELEFKGMIRTLLGEASAPVAPVVSDSVSGANRPLSGAVAPSGTSGEYTVADFTRPAGTAPTVSVVMEAGPDIGPITEKKMAVSDLAAWVGESQELWGLHTPRGVLIARDHEIIEVEGESRRIGEVLGNRSIRWKGYDLKEFWGTTRIANPQAAWDSMLAAYVVKAGNIESFAKLVSLYLGETLPEIPSPAQLLAVHLKLEPLLKRKVTSVSGDRVLQDIELPLIPILHEMECNGILLDTATLGVQSIELEADLRRLEQDIHREAGEAFNIGSTKQLAHILFEKLKLPTGRKTKTGYSTDVDVLAKLATEFPIAGHLLQFRELSKLKSTYVDSLPALVRKETGRIHTHFNQAATTTGRLSSTNPNLQNIPIRTPRGARIRQAFIADPGNVLISADYSQIELRILAHISGDSGLIEAFSNDVDVHTATASEVFGVKREEVDGEMRRKAKAVNFGIAYGQEVFGLAEALQIPRSEAKEIIERYFQKFPGVKQYMAETVEVAREKGYVETLFGRRRHLDELYSKSATIRKFGERAAINAPIQGTAADLVKLAMIKVHRKVPARMLLQVHDELVFEASHQQAEEALPVIRKQMESVDQLRVPLKVNVATGANWDDAH